MTDGKRHVLAQLVPVLGATDAAIALTTIAPALCIDRRVVAEASLGLEPGIAACHAALHQLASGHLQMKGELVLDLVLDGGAPEPGRSAAAGHAGSSKGATAATKVANSFVSARSWRRPLSVIW